MKFEHFALNIPDTRATSQWYVANLGLRVARQMAEDPYTTFLADDSGRIIIEFYSNKAAIFPDYASSHPLCFHIAFVSADPVADAKRLVAAGGSPFSEQTMPDGSVLTMIRDPWGIPLQFVKRGTPFPTIPAL
jgi:catechol 2,3-dioxygenase-like lactoylglutathione lyase family enzyme